VPVAAACAAAGIVVGVASLTGIGLRMSGLIVALSGGSVPVALLLTAAGSLVLGMGLPTTAAYVVLAALGAPALVELGVPLLAAHLFIFYFGCISNVTPPVSLAAFAAAGIAGSPPMRTAASAALLATAGFVIPFMFVYGPELLLQGTPLGVATAALTAMVGIVGLSAAVVGHAHRPLGPFVRVACAAAALLLIRPDAADGCGGRARARRPAAAACARSPATGARGRPEAATAHEAGAVAAAAVRQTAGGAGVMVEKHVAAVPLRMADPGDER
jgi:TRAP-type uncharacterized transport system fused permease subunit